MNSIIDTTTPMGMARLVRMQRNAFPGMYLLLLYMDDGVVLCPNCVRDNFSEISAAVRDGKDHDLTHVNEWYPIGISSTAEIEDAYCAHCNIAVGEID